MSRKGPKQTAKSSPILLYIYKSSAVAEMGDHGHNRHAPKRGGGCCASFAGRGAGSPSNIMWPGPRSVYFCTKWHLDPSSRLATIDMGLKLGGGCAFLGELGPHLTLSPGLRPTSVPSGIVMHPAVWLQLTWAENWRRLCQLGV